MMTGVIYGEINDAGLSVTTKGGESLSIMADTIIPATPMVPNDVLAQALRKAVHEVYIIGDCREPRLISDAIADGWRVAREI